MLKPTQILRFISSKQLHIPMATTTPTPLSLFLKATQKVYGPVPDPSSDPSTLNTWTPPSTPGAGGHNGRYLWTDAFGLLNLLTLSRESPTPSQSAYYLTLAKRLAHTVHDILGRTRDGTARLPLATEEHPLAGGLRIGKLDEGGSDGDGQYHHYLTVWMFALNRLSEVSGEGVWNGLAVELGRVMNGWFVVREGGVRGGEGDGKRRPVRMVWKVSADLGRVLVPSEGHLDAATGFVVYRLVARTAERFGGGRGVLEDEIEDYRVLMVREGKLKVSSDPLDLGMGLWICHFFRGEEWARRFGEESLDVARVLLAEGSGLMCRSASRRLAFREFGTCMGLKCYGMDGELATRVEAVLKFWERYLDDSTDEDLRPISLVMFASALIPGAFCDGYLAHEGQSADE